MKPVLFEYFKKTVKVLETNYDRSAELNGISKHGKNRKAFVIYF
jgi:hypothetical protein